MQQAPQWPAPGWAPLDTQGTAVLKDRAAPDLQLSREIPWAWFSVSRSGDSVSFKLQTTGQWASTSSHPRPCVRQWGHMDRPLRLSSQQHWDHKSKATSRHTGPQDETPANRNRDQGLVPPLAGLTHGRHSTSHNTATLGSEQSGAH